MRATLDFALLTPADALDLAILLEEQARQTYLELVDLVADAAGEPDVLEFLRSMARHEQRHAQELLARRESLYPDVLPRVTAEQLEPLGRIEVPSPTAMLSLRAGLEAALAAEQRAEAYFRQALAEVSDTEVRRLLEELAEEEVEHQRAVTARLVALAPGAEP